MENWLARSSLKHALTVEVGLAACVFALSAATLIFGWSMGLVFKIETALQDAIMVPSTAALFLFASLAVIATAKSHGSPMSRGLLLASGFVIVGLAGANIALKMSGSANGLDDFVMQPDDVFLHHSMSYSTSTAFILLAINLWQLSTRDTAGPWFLITSYAGLGLALLGLFGFLFGASSVGRTAFFADMSLKTASAFSLLFLVIQYRRRDIGLLGLIRSDEIGSKRLRRMLPFAIFFPVAICLLISVGLRAGWFDLGFGLSLLSFISTFVIITLLGRDAKLTNITVRKQADASLKLKEADLAQQALRNEREVHERSARSQSIFLANMSHEIRTPMNGVLGFADMLLDSDLTDQQREYAEYIAESGSSMVSLINDILDLSKIDADAMRIASDAIDPVHTVTGAVNLMRATAMKKGLRLDLECADDLPDFILGDKLRLRQIITNLLGNAIKFTQSGRVAVTAHRCAGESGEDLQIAVSDTGEGIAPERLETIFEQYAQANGTIAETFGGTGLGLAISRRLADLMGGSITVASEPGEGSTFTLRIPLKTASSYEHAAFDVAQVAEIGKATKKCKVLVAEDHPINQHLISLIVRNMGHDCELAENGAETVRKVKAAKSDEAYDLVLMDLQMPVLDGLGATREIRAAGFSAEKLPIVALTANAFGDDVRRCIEAGMQDHLPKPVEAGRVSAMIEKWSSNAADPFASAEAQAIARLRPEFDKMCLATRQHAQRWLQPEAQDIAALSSELEQCLHQLSGTAALFGEEALGELSGQVEGLLREGPVTDIDAQRFKAIERKVGSLMRLLEKDAAPLASAV